MAGLLDWKLDFTDDELEKQYCCEFNFDAAKLTRYILIITTIAVIQTPIVEYFISGSPIFDCRYIVLFVIACWASTSALVLCIPWVVRNYGAITSSFIVAGCCAITNYIDALYPDNYMADLVGTSYSVYIVVIILKQPMIQRMRCKHFMPFMFFDYVERAFLFFTYSALPVQVKLAYMIPTTVAFVISSYAGRFFERQSKLSFFQQRILKDEAENLHWTVARDTSLLRNIFPKNLSDELETQMTKFLLPKQQKNPLLASGSFVGRSLSSLAALREQILQLKTQSNLSSGSPPDHTLRSSAEFASEAKEFTSNPLVRTQQSSSEPDLMKNNVRQRNSKINKGNLSVKIPATPRTDPEAGSTTIFAFPQVITTPSPDELPNSPFLTTSGTPLYTPNHRAEHYAYLSGTRHRDGSRIALSHSYPDVCVLFADIVGSTAFAATVAPDEWVTSLNELFACFDDIMEFHHLEKIRTVGDAYLCVGNMSIPLEHAAKEAVAAGLKMIQTINRVKYALKLRVGIASGPLIAGVTGLTKWNYDIFGKPLAEATAVEALAPSNCIAVTPTVYEDCKNEPLFDFKERLSENEEAYYILNTEEYRGTVETLRFHDQNSDDLAMLTHAWPKKSSALLRQKQQIIDDIVGVPLDDELEDISEHELQNNTSTKFDFDLTDLDNEESDLSKQIMNFKFISSSFEQEFQRKSVAETHDYTRNLSIIFCISCLLYLLMEIGLWNAGLHDLPYTIIAAHLTSTFVFIAYTIYAKYFDFHWTAHYVACFTVCAYMLAGLYKYYVSPTMSRLILAATSLLLMSSFVRVPIIQMLIVESIFSGMAFCMDFDQVMKNHTGRVYTLFFLSMAYSFFTQTYKEKITRKQFLASKRIRYVMYHQRIAQKRSKLLIHNILPHDIIPRLQHQENAAGVVDFFEEATIVFINFTNLESLTENLDPTSRFDVYNDLFTKFDVATKAIGLEKIKTINTVYMVASGLPKKITNHVELAIKLAVEMYSITSKYKHPFIRDKFQVRIGLATGPVVAGIIGKRKYAYDCWSDITNTASRMESNGWEGYLQITPRSFEHVKRKEYFKKRENVHIKGKGEMDTYVLHLAKFVAM